MHLFFAEGVEAGERQPEDDESIELVRIPVAELVSRLGEIEDAKTLAGLLLYLRAAGSEPCAHRGTPDPPPTAILSTKSSRDCAETVSTLAPV